MKRSRSELGNRYPVGVRIENPACRRWCGKRVTGGPSPPRRSGRLRLGSDLGVESNAALQLARGAEVIEVARIDLFDGHDDQDVGGAELTVDHRTVADEGSYPQVALDQRRQGLEGRLRIDLVLRDQIHGDVQVRMGAAAPIRRSLSKMMQETQRHSVLAWIGALEAGAADHDVDLVLAHIGPKAVPEKLDRALGAVGAKHARAPEL